jgi:hypothetical protein
MESQLLALSVILELGPSFVLSLKFRQHMVTRTQHRQTIMKSFMALNLYHSIQKRSKTIQSSEKLKSALQKLGVRAHVRNRNVECAHDVRLLAQKVTHLLNDAFMNVVGLPTTYGSAPKPI